MGSDWVGQISVKGDELGLCAAGGALNWLLLRLLLLTTRGSHLHAATNEDENNAVCKYHKHKSGLK